MSLRTQRVAPYIGGTTGRVLGRGRGGKPLRPPPHGRRKNARGAVGQHTKKTGYGACLTLPTEGRRNDDYCRTKTGGNVSQSLSDFIDQQKHRALARMERVIDGEDLTDRWAQGHGIVLHYWNGSRVQFSWDGYGLHNPHLYASFIRIAVCGRETDCRLDPRMEGEYGPSVRRCVLCERKITAESGQENPEPK